MKLHSQILISSVVFLSFVTGQAQEKCVSGNPGEGNIITQLHYAKAKSEITELIYKAYNLDSKSKTETKCLECESKLAERPVEVERIAAALDEVPSAPKLLYKGQCLLAGVAFKSGAPEVSCPEGKASGKSNLCVTTDHLTYENAVISNFMSCAKKSGLTTLTPASIFQMYSLESAFKPQFASGSGVGMGQITKIFTDDIHQKWRGYKFLEKIAHSDLKECEAAKIIAKKDIQTKPNPANRCAFIQMGEGMERNILYSLIGMANSWEKDLSPKMKTYFEKYANDSKLNQVRDTIMLNAYGPGGRAAARALASRLSSLPPEKFIQRAQKSMSYITKKKQTRSLNAYTMGMKKRQDQLGKSLPEPMKSAFANEGAQACLNP